eukprot:326229-Rhodomonas_salina.1
MKGVFEYRAIRGTSESESNDCDSTQLEPEPSACSVLAAAAAAALSRLERSSREEEPGEDGLGRKRRWVMMIMMGLGLRLRAEGGGLGGLEERLAVARGAGTACHGEQSRTTPSQEPQPPRCRRSLRGSHAGCQSVTWTQRTPAPAAGRPGARRSLSLRT